MSRRISLYFDPGAWESLNRLLALLIVSGKPLYDLPSMNDMIEGMVVYAERIIKSEEASVTDLLSYNSRAFPKERRPGVSNDKGRMAFGVSDLTLNALNNILHVLELARKDNSIEEWPEDLSEPILIRDCVYYVLNGVYLFDFFMNFYISSLYNLKLFVCMSTRENYADYIPYMSNDEIDALKRIALDDSVIFSLDNIGENELFRNRDNLEFNTYSMTDINFQSRTFNFNYYSAMVGFFAILHFNIESTTIPEIIARFDYEIYHDRKWRENYSWMQYYLRTFNDLNEISKHYNSSAVRDPRSNKSDASNSNLSNSRQQKTKKGNIG